MWSGKLFLETGFNTAAIPDGVSALNVGCGMRRLERATNIDILGNMKADVTHDLDQYPWPFKDSSFDLVVAENILEHLKEPIRAMEEIYRILKPGGRVVIRVPYFRHPDAFTDPQHIHFYTSESMDFFISGRHHNKKGYSQAAFKEVGFWMTWPHVYKTGIRGIILKFLHRNIKRYEKHLASIFPVKFLIWELEVVK